MSIVINVPHGANPMLPLIFRRLSTLSPDIREIEIRRLHPNPSTEEASSQLLIQCNPHRLRKYNVDSPISASALRHVVQLPSLEEFYLVVDSLQLPDPLPIVVFPNLRLLDVKYNGDPTWLKLLPAIGNPGLTSIFVECLGPDVAQFMETFQLTMAECGMHERLRQFRVAGQNEFKITPQIIACTFLFKNLTSLEVFSDCSPLCRTSDLTDDHIDLLTKAMPRLETLAIGEDPCGFPSQITFKSLYTISRRCTRLKNLQIHFNPTLFVTKVATDSESGDVALGFSDIKTPSSDLSPVTTINVGCIPLPPQPNASYIIALGLLGVFPRVEKLEYDDDDWEDIEVLIGVCRRLGRFVFGKS